ncbi:hypothetical protein LTR39_004500, partial [Cryomyces antarcticus]
TQASCPSSLHTTRSHHRFDPNSVEETRGAPLDSGGSIPARFDTTEAAVAAYEVRTVAGHGEDKDARAGTQPNLDSATQSHSDTPAAGSVEPPRVNGNAQGHREMPMERYLANRDDRIFAMGFYHNGGGTEYSFGPRM